MKRGLTWLALLSVALATVGFYHAKTARATPPNLFKGTTIAVGTFNEFDVFNQFSNNDLPSGFPGNVWISLQKTKGGNPRLRLSIPGPATDTFISLGMKGRFQRRP